MSIKKIKNLKYSASKLQTNIRWADVRARKYKLLAQSDWTQLQDVTLTEFSKTRWANWRERLRSLSRDNYKSIDYFEREIGLIELDQDTMHTEYIEESPTGNVSSSKMFLRKMLNSFYTQRVSNTFEPNLEEKYQEALELSSELYDGNLRELSVKQLTGFINGIDTIDVDTKPFPFLELVMHTKHISSRDAIEYILTQKNDEYNFSLQEEYNLIHYGNMIDSCVTNEDVVRTKIDIEQHYGY